MALFVFSLCCVLTAIKVLLLLLISSPAVAAIEGHLVMLVCRAAGFAPLPLGLLSHLFLWGMKNC